MLRIVTKTWHQNLAPKSVTKNVTKTLTERPRLWFISASYAAPGPRHEDLIRALSRLEAPRPVRSAERRLESTPEAGVRDRLFAESPETNGRDVK